MKTLSAGVVGAAFAAIVWLGSGNDVTVVPQPAEGTDLAAIGKALIHDHLLSLEVLALLLFLTLVGAGVIARPDVPDETENTP